VKITGWTIHLFETRPSHHQEVAHFARSMTMSNGVAVLHTDEGIDGVVSAGTARLMQLARAWPTVAEHVVGRSPLERLAIEDVLHKRYLWPTEQIGLLDHALWDITGKMFDQPIYKLLGGYRDKVLAYASTIHHSSDERFLETAIASKEAGFRAIKIHPYGILADDMRLCQKVRKAVGDDMILMLDSMSYPGPYTRHEARQMLALLDELRFHWFEDPLDHRDLEGLADLRRMRRHVQIRGADRVLHMQEYAAMVQRGCLDIIAGPTSWGITDLLKLAHFAEVNGMKMEPHDFVGGTASLHALMAIANGTFYEIAVPRGSFDAAQYPGVYLDACWIDAEGYVHAPKKPGLGFEIDFDRARAVTRETIELRA
jgi:L-alanine-DL-glutamate epimerase-like enolase superfamily enzyme